MRNYTHQFIQNLLNKSLMIAGCNGYIGTEFSNQLELNNIQYIGVDKQHSDNKNSLCMNLSDKEQTIKLISSNKPDFFFHAATHSALAYESNFFDKFYDDMKALHHVFLGLKSNPNSRLIYFSSSYVYSGNSIDNKVNEDVKLSPSHNFGIAKSFFEQAILRTFPNSIIFRLSSVFGKGNNPHPNAITSMVNEAMKNKVVTIWGEGVRQMQYIFLEDVVKYVINSPTLEPGIYNLGGHNYETVSTMAEQIATYFRIKTKKLHDKKEGLPLPFMLNKKIISAIGNDYFTDSKEALIIYLDGLANKKSN